MQKQTSFHVLENIFGEQNQYDNITKWFFYDPYIFNYIVQIYFLFYEYLLFPFL